MKLIVGLGNPGAKYRLTRHNFGSLIVENLAKEAKAKFKLSVFAKAKIAIFKKDQEEIMLMLPMTYMNLSGRSLAYILRRKPIKLEDILVVCDDVNLSFGKLRARISGSDGGHNGLKSIIESLQSQDFSRLRIGIGSNKDNLSDFVLSEFNFSEKKELDSIIEKATIAIFDWLDVGIKEIMNKYN